MEQAASSSRVLRFGVFEVDLRSGELRKQGLKIRLQEQPLQVLALLLEHPGQLVTREGLKQKLWPADTFVDFDHSLNTAINKHLNLKARPARFLGPPRRLLRWRCCPSPTSPVIPPRTTSLTE